ncbi:hypothetical protein [Paenisporosarcina sp. TG-14]|uniref:hypothetical protein n=1 Tax=Paenisporosarcina sp. TG-14 TaxID=1231057 RepID=UPI00030687ED|nr:hypothetical protein [Paenisporosarcina sp. TG-14]
MLHEADLKSFNTRLNSISNEVKKLVPTKTNTDTFKRITENLAAVATVVTDTDFEDASYINDKLVAIEKDLP